ncbi:unnamed protein product [Sphagnum jensenii]|uniref:Uncharacterized protein n=1 Tax=Sphagnum jensenii TaxID=128206 RepID=A0ABP0V7L7_9BRYO
MAHMIENNQIAYKGETPWHGLGFRLDENATGEDMLKVAGLDWKVQRRALAMRGRDGSGLIVEPLSAYKAIVRSDTDHVFGVPPAAIRLSKILKLSTCSANTAKLATLRWNGWRTA